jgi:hypothetical protein
LREPGSATVGQDLANVVMQSGFFVGIWGGPDTRGRLAHRPAEDLGPRYTITYTMAVPGRPSSDIIQYVFPYAEPQPITYMPSNQKYWGNAETAGAWFAGSVGLRGTLIRSGLPEAPPSGAHPPVVAGHTNPIPTLGPLAFLLAAVFLFATGAFALTGRLSVRRVSRMWMSLGAFLLTWGLLSAIKRESFYHRDAPGYLAGATLLLASALVVWYRARL